MTSRLGAFLVASVVDERAAEKMPQDDGARNRGGNRRREVTPRPACSAQS